MPWSKSFSFSSDPISAIIGLHSARQQRGHDRRMVDQQMNFRKYMSNTAYQRAMADLRSAGLNPLLVGKMGGASTPTGAIAKAPSTADHIAKVSASRLASGQLKLAQQQSKVAAANVLNINSATALNKAKENEVKEKVIRAKGQNRYEFGDYEGLIKVQELDNLKQQERLLKTQVSKTNLENKMRAFKNNWFINIYGAPKETLTAKVQNYVLSKAFTKLKPKDEHQLIQTIHKAVKFISQNAEKVMDDPTILQTLFGATASGFLLKMLLDTLPTPIGPGSGSNIPGFTGKNNKFPLRKRR